MPCTAKAICSPFSGESSGRMAVKMPRPSRGRVAAAKISRADSQFAWDRSSLNRGTTTRPIIAARAIPYAREKAQMPSRCVIRRTGAMNVYSMVPSHRSGDRESNLEENHRQVGPQQSPDQQEQLGI